MVNPSLIYFRVASMSTERRRETLEFIRILVISTIIASLQSANLVWRANNLQKANLVWWINTILKLASKIADFQWTRLAPIEWNTSSKDLILAFLAKPIRNLTKASRASSPLVRRVSSIILEKRESTLGTVRGPRRIGQASCLNKLCKKTLCILRGVRWELRLLWDRSPDPRLMQISFTNMATQSVTALSYQ